MTWSRNSGRNRQIAELGKRNRTSAGDTIRVGSRVTEGTRTRVQNYEGVIARKNGKNIAARSPFAKFPLVKAMEHFPCVRNIDSITVVGHAVARFIVPGWPLPA
jgi:large subunit ribosomal protein L19